jgi:Bacterial Ig domain
MFRLHQKHPQAATNHGLGRYRSCLQLVLLAVAVSVLSIAGLAQTVTVQTPANNSVVTSPVTIRATVQDSVPLWATQIYVDGVKRAEVTTAGINATLDMASGIHRVGVQAIDHEQRVFKSVLYITVAGAAAPPTPAAPAAGLTTWKRVEEMTGWQTCGNCGNTGATGAVASYEMTRGITSPSEDGSSAEFAIAGPAYSNGYWYIGQHPAPANGLQYLAYQFDLYIPAGDQNDPQAIEFECQQGLNGWTYNFAWQAEYTANVWRVFNYVTKQWESTGIPLNRFTPGVWHHILAEYHNDPVTHVVYHDALTVDGVRHQVNLAHNAKSGGSGNYLNNAFQLDLNGKGTPYQVYVDKMSVSYQ